MTCYRVSEQLLLLVAILGLCLSNPAGAQNRTWNLNGAGDYDTAANWDPADVPDASGENAVITTPDGTSAALVTLTSTTDVGDVSILSNGANPDHQLVIDDGVFFDIFGELANDGVLRLNSSGSTTRLRAEGSDLDITGGGSILLGANDNNSIGAVSDLTITNGANHTIAGQGNIGINTARITNLGTLDANLAGATLTLDPRSAGDGVTTFDNQGTAQASGGGVLKLTGSGGGEFEGGLFSALTGSEVVLEGNAVVRNATISSSGTGVLRVSDADGALGATFENVTVNGQLELDGDLDVSGSFSYGGNSIVLGILGLRSDATFTGGGTLSMVNSLPATVPTIRDAAPGPQSLTIGDFTIEGEGRLGSNTLSIINTGLVDANTSGRTLAIDVVSQNQTDVEFDNQSIVQASNGGTLELTDAAGESVFGGIGVYQALAGSKLIINREVFLRNTTVSSADDGVIQIGGGGVPGISPGGGGAFFVDVTNNGTMQVLSSLKLRDSLVNTGSIALDNPSFQPSIFVETDTVLSGGGTITLQTNNALINGTSNVRFTNVDNTIQGAGRLGGGQLVVTNQSLIEANIAGGDLTIDPATSAGGELTFDNQGIVQASGGGRVILTSGSGEKIFGGSGVYRAQAGSTIILNRSVVMQGTTFNIPAGGLFQVGGGGAVGGATLRNINTNGDLQLTASTVLGGTLNNSGAITTQGGIGVTLESDTTLSGEGTFTLQGATSSVSGVLSSPTLTNIDNLIQGQGRLGNGRIEIVNQSTIDANVPGGTLTLQVDSPAAGIIGFDNQSVVQASNGGRIVITRGSGDGEFGGPGVYQALAGSEIALERSVILRNTTLDTSGDGVIRSTFSSNTLVDVANNGLLEVTASMRVTGTLNNAGTIDLQGSTVGLFEFGGPAVLEVASSGSVVGTGDLNLPTNNSGSIIGDNGSFIEVNGLLTGEGSLENVRIDNIHAPGNSTAIVSLAGDYTIANSGELHLELIDMTPGSGHDQLNSTGTVNIDGDLVVEAMVLGSGYEAAAGDRFTIIQSTSAINGTFDTASLPDAVGQRLVTWEPIDYTDPNSVVLEIASVGFFAADFDEDGDVDSTDLTLWNAGYGTAAAAHGDGDANGDGDVNGADWLVWQRQLGLTTPQLSAAETVPEPTTLVLVALGAVLLPKGKEML